MVLAIFVWVLVLVLAACFLVSYLLWSPRSKSPQVIATEVMYISSQVTYVVGGFSLCLGVILFSLWLLQLVQSL